MPARTASGRTVLRRQRVEIDEQTLERIAVRTGAQYFHAKDAKGLTTSYAEIDRLERTEISELRFVEYEELFAPFVIAALLLLILAEFFSHTILRRLP